MWTTREKVVQHIEIALVQEISIEFKMRKLMLVLDTTHSQEILARHMQKFQLLSTTRARLWESRNKILELLAADAAISNLGAVLKTVDIQNEIEESELAIKEPLQIILTCDESPKTMPNGGSIKIGRDIYKNI